MTATNVNLMFALASVATVVVWAQNAHFKHGSPNSIDNGSALTLTVLGNLTGLGNGDAASGAGRTSVLFICK